MPCIYIWTFVTFELFGAPVNQTFFFCDYETRDHLKFDELSVIVLYPDFLFAVSSCYYKNVLLKDTAIFIIVNEMLRAP